MEPVRQFLFTAVNEYPQAVFFTGLGLVVVGLIWILVLLFSMFRRAIWPMLALVAGLVILVGPWVLALNGWLKDTRPRERIVGVNTVVTLTGAKVDYGEYLKDRSDIDVLKMANPDVTDETLQYLTGCKHLTALDVKDTAITDAGLATLATLPLKSLEIQRTAITDQGFRQHLMPMETLLELNLSKTKVEKTTGDEWEKAKKGRRLIQIP